VALLRKRSRRCRRVAVIYFQNGFVIERAFYSVPPAASWGSYARQSCLENIEKIYTDRRSPPRGVREIRASGS
jgi:hypothetical protein